MRSAVKDLRDIVAKARGPSVEYSDRLGGTGKDVPDSSILNETTNTMENTNMSLTNIRT